MATRGCPARPCPELLYCWASGDTGAPHPHPHIRLKAPCRTGGVDYRVTDDDRERVRLLAEVSKSGFKRLSLPELRRLQSLVEEHDYAHSRKAARSKKKLLSQINNAIYKAEEEGRWP